RSRFLLDQDRAVRSANLAAIYQADGMEDVSVREAARGVDSDYATASSHLFLANSYNALRDPKRINLRYETPWFNELLLANLLAPQDTIFFQTKYQDVRQGDLLQYYDQRNAAPGLHFRELQQPAIILAGYHHEWAPGVHTLVLAGRLADEIFFSDHNKPADINAFLQSGVRLNVSRS